MSWNKQSGHLMVMANYTFSKALGIRGENGSAAPDPTNINNLYGTLPNNRTHIFNVAYVYELPKLARSNQVLKAIANNWQISGITQFQSGSDLQAAVSSNFNFSAFIPAGTTFMGTAIPSGTQMSDSNMIGTPDITLMPKVTCDPRSNLGSHQYINGACFARPAVGHNGDYVFPVLTGPAFINSDITLFKKFTMGKEESRKIELRFSGYNFLNHAVDSFVSNDPALLLTFDQSGKMTNQNFGIAQYKTGHRIMQASLKFIF